MKVEIFSVHRSLSHATIQAALEAKPKLDERKLISMTESRIRQIQADIEAYERAIENAEGALAEAERELVEELDRRYREGAGE